MMNKLYILNCTLPSMEVFMFVKLVRPQWPRLRLDASLAQDGHKIGARLLSRSSPRKSTAGLKKDESPVNFPLNLHYGVPAYMQVKFKA